MTTSEIDQPYPDSGDPAGPGAQPPAPQLPKRPVVFIIIATLMFVVAATFGTLWIVERGDHKATTEQVSTKDGQLRSKDQALADEQKAHDGTKSKLSEAEKAKADAEGKVTALDRCAAAGKEFVKLALANASDAEGEKAVVALMGACAQ